MFTTRKEWLAHCKAEATRLREQYQPWVMYVREGGLTHGVLFKTHPIGAVAIVNTDGALRIGASCSTTVKKFNRHEAVMRAIQNACLMAYQPAELYYDKLVEFKDVGLIPGVVQYLPKKCQEVAHWMLHRPNMIHRMLRRTNTTCRYTAIVTPTPCCDHLVLNLDVRRTPQ